MSTGNTSASTDDHEFLMHQALVKSARDLSMDERYILHRLMTQISSDPNGVYGGAAGLVTVQVDEFAAMTHISLKAAYRRLSLAGDKILRRWLRLRYQDESGFDSAWMNRVRFGEEFFEFSFTGRFIRYVLLAVTHIQRQANTPLLAFGEAITAPVSCARGEHVPAGLPVVMVSRLKARKKRRKVMPWAKLAKRLIKRLEKKMPMSLDLKDRVMDAIEDHEPWRTLCRRRFQEFTSRDLDELYDFVIAKARDPNFL